MELIIAVVLFVAIVASWLFLPGAPIEQSAGGAAPMPVSGAGRTA